MHTQTQQPTRRGRPAVGPQRAIRFSEADWAAINAAAAAVGMTASAWVRALVVNPSRQVARAARKDGSNLRPTEFGVPSRHDHC
jgi:hypothetical protein